MVTSLVFCFLLKPYAGLIAPVGQASAQVPQSEQMSGLIE